MTAIAGAPTAIAGVLQLYACALTAIYPMPLPLLWPPYHTALCYATTAAAATYITAIAGAPTAITGVL